MNVLITGATGFIGGALLQKLFAEGHNITVIVHDQELSSSFLNGSINKDRLHIVRGSFLDLQTCERAMIRSNPRMVFHLGAQAMVQQAKQDPHATIDANVRGTYNMLEAFRRHRQKTSAFVLASSDKAYGDLQFGDAYYEDVELCGQGPYDVSKSCADLIAQSYAKSFSFPVGIVRAGNVYGPGDIERSRIIPSIMAALVCNRDPTIFSDGTPVRDYLYIDDAVQGYMLVGHEALNNFNSLAHQYRAYNLSGEKAISVINLVERVIKLSGSNCQPLILGERKGEILYQSLDCTRAHTELNWKPQVNIDSGLLKTYHWWKERVRYGL